MTERYESGDSPVDREVAAFRAWLLASGGKAARTVSARTSAYRSVLSTDPHLPARPSVERMAEAVSRIPEWQRKEARPLGGLLALVEDDREEMHVERAFTFKEVNPGIGSFGFGAEIAGGEPVGAVKVSPRAEGHYRTYHGEESILEQAAGDDADLTLVTLPFTAFPKDDPALAELLVEAAAAKTPHVLIRMDWTTASEMGIEPQEMITAVAAYFPALEVRHFTVPNLPFVPMKGEELFIGLSAGWTSPFRMVASDPAHVDGASVVHADAVGLEERPASTPGVRFPSAPADRIDSDYLRDPRAALLRTKRGVRPLYPQEIARLLGIPAGFGMTSHLDTAYHLLGESVVVPLAARAVRGLLRAVELS